MVNSASVKKLQQRGIETPAYRLGWRNGRDGWEFPVMDSTGCTIGRRWKAYNSSATPKYRWIQRLSGDSSKGFYHIGEGLTNAIHSAGGVLHFVNGEPAVLTMLAAGINNTVCVFGEGIYPDGIAETLISWHVSKVVYYADKDATGERSAGKLAGLLASSGIQIECRSMLDTMPDKSDVNDLWQSVGFKADTFALALAALPIFTPPIQRETKPLESIKSTGTNSGDKWAEFVDTELRPALGRVGIQQGKKHGLCINPAHDDHHPSARISERGVYVCTCGSHSMKVVAGWLGMDFKTWVQIKYPDVKLSRKARSAKTQRETIQLVNAATLAPFTADIKFSNRYVSDAPSNLLNAACIALKSITGSGKSKWAAQSTTNAPSLLTIAFRTSLVKAQAKDYDALVYDAIEGADNRLISSADRVSTTIDSLHKFAERPSPFHTIVIDEWVSLIGHFSSAGTLKEKGASTWGLLKRLITNATRVIVMDATLTDESLAELKALRGDLICIENCYIQPKASTQILPNRLAFFSTALQRIHTATTPVLLGVTSPSEARLTKDLILGAYPNKRIRVITVKQSHLRDTQAFVREINNRLSEIDVLIFNGAMSTGVDIQAEVDSIICLIDRPLSPADGVQMLGRARKAPFRAARVPDSIDGLKQDAADVFQSLELATKLNHIESSKPVRSLARLHARHESRRNEEMSDYLSVFRAYCHADGSDTQAAIVRFDQAIAEKIKAIREGQTKQKRADVLDIDRVKTITPDMLEIIRTMGTEEITPEIDAGYLRHKIESATGQPVTEALYDKYHTREARAALYRAEISRTQNPSDIDHRENAEDIPLHQRTNATAIQTLYREGLKALGVNDLADLHIALKEAQADNFKGFGTWARENIPQFKALLNYRGGHDGDLADDVKAVRFFLKRFGVTLKGKQVMRNGNRFMCYEVDAQEILEQMAIIELRRQQATKDNPITTKRLNRATLPFRSNSIDALNHGRKPTKCNIRASKVNPFSQNTSAMETV